MNASELLYVMSQDIGSLTTGEKMFGASIVTLLSMGIVFVVLVVLMAAVKAMNHTIAEKPRKVSEGNGSEADLPASFSEPVKAEEDDEEVIAVISAALASAMNKSVAEIRVISVKRAEEAEPLWAKNGRWNQMNSRL
ncbi:MAG: OadG family protein [Peptostreptococcaceae bacterium]|nr:OadG family protein [Peptostreptococcaceae bacterium]